MNDAPRFSNLSDDQLRVLHSVCESFEQELLDGKSVPIEPLIVGLDQTLQGPLALELMAIEVELGFKGDRKPSLENYQSRFPEYRAEISRLFNASKMGLQIQLKNDSATPGGSLTGSHPSVGVIAGTQIDGRYLLTRKVGEGGMGEVWAADQISPVKRTVAIKLIKTGMDSRAVISRFEQERQALALMDHPNIAQVFDAGVTDRGQPYFVMEFVNGLALGSFCDERRLTPNERLELFVPICQAVQHAHQKGIVHRDLKPTNILVSMIDDRPVPMVIDFGVAKATGPKLTEESIVTQLGTMVGTLAYMSPEQAGLAENDIDTRADIYSLGVILYELLTGLRPIDCKRLASDGLAEMVRVIQEEEPSRPSTKLSSNNHLPAIAAQRSVDPRKLPAMLKGELDWLVMKCLDKQRERRYGTANALARDIQRYLLDEPIEARPPSASYRFSKFVHRNKGLVIASGLIGLLLVGGIVGTGFGLFRAESARRKAVRAEASATERAESERRAKLEATRQSAIAQANAENEKRANAQAQKRLRQVEKSNEILASVFDSLQPSEIAESNRPLQAVLVEKLNLAVQQLEGESIGDPLVVAQMQMQLGRSLLVLSEPAQARELFEKAQKTRLDLLGPHDPKTFACDHNLAMAILTLGDIQQAIQMLEETLELQLSILGESHVGIPASKNNLAQAYIENSQPKKALPLMKDVVARQSEFHGKYHPETLRSVSILAEVYDAIGQSSRAMGLHKKNLDALTTALGPNHPTTLLGMLDLASSYQEVGKAQEALAMFESCYQRMKETLGHDHATTILAMGRLASLYKEMGHERALPLLEETYQRSKDKFGSEHQDTLMSMSNLASGYQAVGQKKQALEWFQRTHGLTLKKLGADHQNTLRSGNNLAMSYQALGMLDEALPLFEQTLDGMKRTLAENHPSTLKITANLAAIYQDNGEIDVAIPLFEDVLRIQEATLGAEHPDALRTMNNLAVAYWSEKQLDKSIPMFRKLVEATTDMFGEQHPNTLMTIVNLGVNLKDNGEVDEALTWLETAYDATNKYPQLLPLVGPQLLDGYALAGKTKMASTVSKRMLEAMRLRMQPGSVELAETLANNSLILIKAKAFRDAGLLLDECVGIYETESPNSWKLFHVKAMQGESLLGDGKLAEAEPLLLAGIEGLEKHLPKIPERQKKYLVAAQKVLIRCYEEAGKLEQAQSLRQLMLER